ncbi:uncharacterized protein LOC134532935 isoform X2 [Bacillus rossius redtenbacheri]
MDQIFDSLNGSELYPQSGKPLRCALSDKSPHIEFWQEEAKSKIQNWEFCFDPSADRRLNRERKTNPPPCRPGKRRSSVSHPPSQWGWITSINAAIHVWNVLSEAGFQYLQLRNLNQDALENLFGAVRSYCGSNFNPTTSHFTAALKTAVINNLAFKGYSGNCQPDNASVLTDLQSFLLGHKSSTHDQVSSGVVVECCDKSYVRAVTEIEIAVQGGEASVMPAAYVAGYVARKVLNIVSCNECGKLLMGCEEDFCNTAISFKEFEATSRKLTYPSQNLVTVVAHCELSFEEIMCTCSHSNNLLATISNKLAGKCDFLWLREGECQEHCDVIEHTILKSLCEILVRWWCKRFNRNLISSKKNLKHARKMSILKHK